jgi:hypothetical protein
VLQHPSAALVDAVHDAEAEAPEWAGPEADLVDRLLERGLKGLDRDAEVSSQGVQKLFPLRGLLAGDDGSCSRWAGLGVDDTVDEGDAE